MDGGRGYTAEKRTLALPGILPWSPPSPRRTSPGHGLSTTPGLPDRDRVSSGHSVRGGGRPLRRSATAAPGARRSSSASSTATSGRSCRSGDCAGATRGFAAWTSGPSPRSTRTASRGRRANARGVDLNRNFGFNWSGRSRRRARLLRGPAALLEPGVARRSRADPAPAPDGDDLVPPALGPGAGAVPRRRPSRAPLLAAQRAAEAVRGERLTGTATCWLTRFPRIEAFVVQPGPEGSAPRLAATPAPPRSSPATASAAAAGPTPARRPVPAAAEDLPLADPLRGEAQAGHGRLLEAALRASGKRRPRRVEHVVQHFAVTELGADRLRHVRPNRPDVEYGELPGVSPTSTTTAGHLQTRRPGHPLPPVVGLNFTSRSGSAHRLLRRPGDGQRAAAPRRPPPQPLASVPFLGLDTRRVIGHNESLSSPFYRELDPRFKGRTHGDFCHRTMVRYRRKLSRLGPRPRGAAYPQAPPAIGGAVGSSASAPLLARQVLLDHPAGWRRPLGHVEQVRHQRDLLDLRLDEPLHELLAAVVLGLAGQLEGA